MIKLVGIFGLAEGVDPDEFYKFWVETHVPEIKRATGDALKKYVIDRLVWSPDESIQYCCVAQLWFDDLDTGKKALERMRVAGVRDGFPEKVKNLVTMYTMEKEIEL